MPNEIKLCKDCQYYLAPIIKIGDDEVSVVVIQKINHPDEALCNHPDFFSLVDGSVTMRCELARSVKHFCGRDANKFKPKAPDGTGPDFDVIDD